MSASATRPEFDLGAYLRRIGVARSEVTVPDHATLARVVLAHARSIPYENLDKFTGHDVGLDLASLTLKLVQTRRGGGCYENNLLLDAALNAIGYSTTYLAGRVLWTLPSDAPMPPRGHLLLRVDLPDGAYLVDVGFGASLITGALALEPGVEQATPHGWYRLMPDGPAYVLEARIDGVWRALYRFDNAEQYFADFALVNWYNAHHPGSLFVNEMLLARADADRRYTLRGSRADGVQLGVHHVEGPTERRSLASPPDVLASLHDHFHLDVSGIAGLDGAVSRLLSA